MSLVTARRLLIEFLVTHTHSLLKSSLHHHNHHHREHIITKLKMALSTYQDFFQLTVKQLKHYLAVRGLNQDERHAELVARAFVAMEMKMTIVASEEVKK